jgi:hypothetical protein
LLAASAKVLRAALVDGVPVVESKDSLGAGHGGDDVHFAGVVGYGDACCGHFGEVAALVRILGHFGDILTDVS